MAAKAHRTKNTNTQQRDSQSDLTHFILLGLLAIILFYPPYFRGLFFQTEQQWHVLFAGTLGIFIYAWRVAQGKLGMLTKPLDYLVFGLVVAYFIAFFGAAAPRLAIAEIIKYIIYFFVFWTTSRIIRDEGDINIILHTFFLSAIGVALAGVMTATEIININDGFVYGRIFSTMQYPNSLASYLAGVSFIGIYLWSKQEGYVKYLYTAGTYALITVFLSAASRGSMLFFPATFVLYVIFLNKENRLKNTVHTAVIVLGGIVANYRLIPDALEKDYTGTWMWFFLGLALTLVLDFIIDYAVKNYRQYAKQALIAVLVLALGFLSIGIYKAVANHQTNKFLPQNLTESIKNIDLEDRNVQERFVFDKDAVKIFKKYPIFGAGGGVFEETFRYYQSYFYSSTQVHSHDFQVLAETGIFGFAMWIGVFLLFLWTFFKYWLKGDSAARLLLTSIFATGFMLWFHAWIDFDFSLSSIPIVYFSMIGLTRGFERITNSEDKVWPQKDVKAWGWWMVGAFALAVSVFFVFDTRLILAEKSAKQAYGAYAAGDQAGAIPYYEKAHSYDPWKIEYISDLAKMQMNEGKAEQAIANMEKAAQMNKYNAQIHSDIANMYWGAGKYDEAVIAMEKARENFKFNSGVHEAETRIKVMAGLLKLQQEDLKVAASYFESAAQTPERINKLMKDMPEKYITMWGTQAVPVLTVTPMVKLNVGIAWHFLGDANKAKTLLIDAYTNQQTKGEAAFWLAVINKLAGDEQAAQGYLVEAQQLEPEFAKDYQTMVTIPTLK